MLKILTIISGALLLTHAHAQNIPPLPGPIAPGPQDTETFICDVSSINEDFIDRSSNLWTTAARGGKFQALGPIRLRVKSQSETSAAAEVFDFYKKYAAAAYVKSPMYDRGTRLTQKYVVSKCVVDSTRATKTNLKNIPLSTYKSLATAQDHIINFLAINKTQLTDEQIATLVSPTHFSSDAFERREQIQKTAALAKDAAKKSPSRYIILEGSIFLGDYNFEKNNFDLAQLKSSAEKYTYQAPRGSATHTPTYNLTVPARLVAYTPSSIDEAKKIERARTKSPYMKLKTYVQLDDATYSQGTVVTGTIAAIEVTTGAGEFLFKLPAQ
jgi:hypothetical protein